MLIGRLVAMLLRCDVQLALHRISGQPRIDRNSTAPGGGGGLPEQTTITLHLRFPG
jgi:hypothetical protein